MIDDLARRRAALVALLVVLLIATVAAGSPAREHVASVASLELAVPAVQSPHGVRSAAWYCPLAGADLVKGSPGAITLSNTRRSNVHVEVAAIAGGAVVSRVRVVVAAASSRRIALQQITKRADAALLVEPFGAGVVVEHDLTVATDFATSSCASKPAPNWYFPAGTTVKRAKEYVALFNPYRDDAVVDVTLYTDVGRREPSAWQGLAVAGRSRVVLAINRGGDRKHVVAVRVAARDGARVVAEQVLVHKNVNGVSGVALSLGAIGASTRATLVDGSQRPSLTRQLFVLNPNEAATDVEIEIVGTDGSVIPSTAHVEGASAIAVDLMHLASRGSAFSVVVITPRRHPVVVEDLTGYQPNAHQAAGLAVTVASPVPTRSWVFASDLATSRRAATLLISNPGAVAAHVSVRLVGGGRISMIDGPPISVAPRSRFSVQLAAVTGRVAVLVDADRPVIVEQLVEGRDGVNRSAGVPAVQ